MAQILPNLIPLNYPYFTLVSEFFDVQRQPLKNPRSISIPQILENPNNLGQN